MPKIVGTGMILFGVILFLFRHSISAGGEVAVAAAIFWPILGIVVFLFGMQTEKYFIEISGDGINVNDTEIITWRDIKEVKIVKIKYMYFFVLGKPIEILHFDIKGMERVTRLSSKVKEREKLYKVIKDHIK